MPRYHKEVTVIHIASQSILIQVKPSNLKEYLAQLYILCTTFTIEQNSDNGHVLRNLARTHKMLSFLTHWGRVTHLCVSKLTSIASDNGLSPGRRQAIIWNNAGILLIGPLGTKFSEIQIEIQTFSLKKIRLKMSSAKCRPFCLGLNVLRISSTQWLGTSTSISLAFTSKQFHNACPSTILFNEFENHN